MARFTNVDYNKVQYQDENPFWASYKESAKEARELAKAAYEKKRNEFIEDYFENLAGRVLPPKEGKAIVNGKVNPAFYNFTNYSDPYKVLQHMKKMAPKYGLSPSSVRVSDVEGRLDPLIQSAKKRSYGKIRDQRDEIGDNRLQNILQQDRKFMSTYRKYEDPLYQSDRLTFIKESPALKNKINGWEINEERGVVSKAPNWLYGAWGLSGNPIETDTETGIRYAEDWMGIKHYIDAPVMSAWGGLNPISQAKDEYNRLKWYKDKGVDFY